VRERPVKGAAFSELIAGQEFIALDIETTSHKGTPRSPDEWVTYVISVGAVVVLNDQLRLDDGWYFHELANPGVPVATRDTKYNGIKTSDLRKAQTVPELLDHLDAFLTAHPDAPLVCHNGGFDITHLAEAYERHAKPMFDRPVLDTQFIGAKLRVPGIGARIKLTALCGEYGITSVVEHVPARQRRLHKGLKDAMDAGQALNWLMAEAAERGVLTLDEFLDKAAPRTCADIITHAKRRERFHAPEVSEEHARRCHGKPLGTRASQRALDTWIAQAGECVALRCPFLAEKVTSASAHKADLFDRLTALLPDAATRPGAGATLLLGLTPWLAELDRSDARAWYESQHLTIKASARCEPYAACPACVARSACPLDVTYELLTRRALDYRTKTGEPASLLDDAASKDLYEGKRWRKIDTWPAKQMPELAAHMVWAVAREARSKGSSKYSGLLAAAVERGLHKADPHLALEVARHWATNPQRDDDITALVTEVLAGATSNPAYLELDVWYSGPYRLRVEGRTPQTPRPRLANPRREPAPEELRPVGLHHRYRYQLHRRPTQDAADAS
jgi:DNA polymerase III epsilon subunit-like protein